MYAADCRKLDGSAAAETYLDLLSADQYGHYALAARKPPDLFDSFWVVIGADFFVGHAALLEVLFGGSTEGTTGLGIDDNLLRCSSGASPLIEFIELLDDETNIVVALLLPDT